MQFSLRRIGCFALVLVLMFTIFAAPPAQANPIIAVGAVAALVALCGMIGITFATTDAAKEAAQMVSAYDDLWEDINSIYIPPSGGGHSSIEISAATTAMVGTILYRLKSLFNAKNEGTFLAEDPSRGLYDDIIFHYNDWFSTGKDAYSYAPYTTLDKAGRHYYITNVNPDYPGWYTIVYNGVKMTGLAAVDVGSAEVIGKKFGFCSTTFGGNPYLTPYIAVAYKDVLGVTQYKHKVYNPTDAYYLIPVIGEYENATYEVPYKSKSSYLLKDVTSGIEKLVTDVGTITLPMTDIETAIDTGTDEDIDKDHDYFVDLLPGLKELLEKNRIDTEESIGDLNPPTLDGDSLLDKFPFCVPKDLYLLVTALQAPAEAPKWTIPIKFDVVDFYEEYEFDLSRFDTLAAAIRWGLTLIFLAGLIMVSRKMIKG